MIFGSGSVLPFQLYQINQSVNIVMTRLLSLTRKLLFLREVHAANSSIYEVGSDTDAISVSARVRIFLGLCVNYSVRHLVNYVLTLLPT